MSPLFGWRRAVNKLHGLESTGGPIIRRPYNEAERRSLVVIWKRAVLASYDFLSFPDIGAMETGVRTTYLPNATLRLAVDETDAPLGFIGMRDNHIEMLFVDPTAQRDGIGTALLADAVEQHGVVTAEVNEQNALGHDWLINRGFTQTGRSDTDADGRPYPLLHLHRPAS